MSCLLFGGFLPTAHDVTSICFKQGIWLYTPSCILLETVRWACLMLAAGMAAILSMSVQLSGSDAHLIIAGFVTCVYPTCTVPRCYRHSQLLSSLQGWLTAQGKLCLSSCGCAGLLTRDFEADSLPGGPAPAQLACSMFQLLFLCLDSMAHSYTAVKEGCGMQLCHQLVGPRCRLSGKETLALLEGQKPKADRPLLMAAASTSLRTLCSLVGEPPPVMATGVFS